MAYEALIKEFDRDADVLYYQIDCLEKHPEIPALPVRISIREDRYTLEADISGKISLMKYLAGRSLVREEWLRLLLAAGEAVRRGKECFLDPERFALSLNEIFLPADLEKFSEKELYFLYIPVLYDQKSDSREIPGEIISQNTAPDPELKQRPNDPGGFPKDPLLALGREVLQFLSANRIFYEEIFSLEEEEQIASWSADILEQGMDAFRGMIEGKPPHENRVQAGKSSNKPLFCRSFHPFPGVVIPFAVVLILGAEMVLIAFAFQIMKRQSCFHNPATPVLLISAILICCAGLDFYLFLKRQPLFQIDKKSDALRTDCSDIEGGAESASEAAFSIKEEKTVLLCPSSGSRRIAMLCSGIPGTLEEGKGQKAYILSDDFLIGRERSKVDFRINSLTVGRIHARILRRENSFFIEDLGSRNGTFVNQKKLKRKEEMLLPENCQVCFADKEFYFVAD